MPNRDDCAGPSREVVAVLVFNQGELCLVRRSSKVSSDPGQWHCVTGFVDPDTMPIAQAVQEVEEELGFSPPHLDVQSGAELRLDGWLVHVFAVHVNDRRVRLNWENDAYRWLPPGKAVSLPHVWWLVDVCGSLGAEEYVRPSRSRSGAALTSLRAGRPAREVVTGRCSGR